MKKFNDWYERWIFETYRTDPASLGVYRIVFAAVLLLVELPLYLWIPRFADSFFNPPIGLTLPFSGFPPAWFFDALNFAIVLALLSLLVGYRTRLASLGLATLLLVGHSWMYSFGKINHDILYILIPLVMAFSSWGDRYSLDGLRGAKSNELASAWPVCLLMLLTAAGMGYAGLVKATTGWLDPSSSAVRGHMTRLCFNGERDVLFGPALLQIDVPWLWEAADLATVVLEVGFLPALFSRRLMRVVCAVACVFHVLVFIGFNIPPFTSNLLAYAVLVNWSWVVPRLPRPRWPAVAPNWRMGLWPVLVAALVVGSVLVLVGNPLKEGLALLAGGKGELLLHTLVCVFALAIVAGYIVFVGWKAIQGAELAARPVEVQPGPK